MALKIRVPLPLRRDAERPRWRYHAERGNEHVPAAGKIVPALRVGMQPVTLRVTPQLRRDAERPRWRYHAERGNEHAAFCRKDRSRAPRGYAARDAPRHPSVATGRGASWEALPRGAWERAGACCRKDRSRAPRGNAARDAPRHPSTATGRGASQVALPRGAWERACSLLPERSFPRSAWVCSP